MPRPRALPWAGLWPGLWSSIAERGLKSEHQRPRAHGASSFRLRHSLVIRLSSFVIFLCASTLPAADPKPPCCRALPPGKPLTDKSLYQLDSTWTSDVGREVKLGVLRGRVQVVAMFFAQCEYACPIIVENMRVIETALPAALRDRVDFLLVSFDTERDTPEVLRAYRNKTKLAPAHWTLLRGGTDDVRELAALLGVNYQRDARGQFAHSNVITVLNAEGEVAFQQAGLNKDSKETISAVEKALAAAAATISTQPSQPTP